MSSLLASFVVHGLLLLVVVVAGALAARRLGGGDVVGVAAGLIAAGVVAYATGVVWFWSPSVGVWVSRLVPVACVAYTVRSWRRDRTRVEQVLRSLSAPVGLTGFWALFVLGMGYLYGDVELGTQVSTMRFSWQLPADNALPLIFARTVEQAGHLLPPTHLSTWLSSDRPPLQSAFWLAHALWSRSEDVAWADYQVLGVLLQSTWVLGVWALASALGVRKSVRALAVAACAASGQVLLNTFYVWPKLLTAAFVLVSAALVVRRGGLRTPTRLGLAAAAATLAFLGHGGAAFALIPIAAVGAWQALRDTRRLRTLGAVAAGVVPLWLPWLLYQRYVDPPGNRLLKWMLAEVEDVDPRPVLTTIADRYREVGLGGALHDKAANVAQVLGYPWRSLRWSGFDALVDQLRVVWFYSLVPSFAILLVLLLGWLWARRSGRASAVGAARDVSLLWLAGVATWCVLAFGPRTTVTHQGTYAFVLLGAVALVLAGALASVRWTAVLVALQAAVTLVVYVPLLPLDEAAWTQDDAVSKKALVLLLLGLVGFVGTLVASVVVPGTWRPRLPSWARGPVRFITARTSSAPAVRPHRAWLVAHLVLLAAAAAVLLWANRGQWFFGDEWEFLYNRGLPGRSRAMLWIPHNGHWSTVPVLVYVFLRNTFGLASYWPYVAVLIAVHLTLTHLLWRVMLRAGAAPLVATAAAAVFSLLGAGAENLLWAFQIGFVGAVAFGWGAALLASTPERRVTRRDLWVVLLLVGSLMCAGIGVPMVVVATVAVLASSRSLWRALVVASVPAVVFVTWYMLVGRLGSTSEREHHYSVGDMLELIRDGLVTDATTASGLSRALVAAALVCLVLWALWVAFGVARGWPRFADRGLVLAGGCGVLVFGLMVAFGRGTLGASRYVYVISAMALPLAALALSELGRRRWVQGVVTVGFVVVGVHNVHLLQQLATAEAAREGWTREVIESAAALALADPTIGDGAPEPVYDPDITMSQLPVYVERNHLPAQATERGTLAVRLALQVGVADPGAEPDVEPAEVVGADGLVPTDADTSCLVSADPAAPGAVRIDPDGTLRAVQLRAADAARYEVTLGSGDSAPPARYVDVPAGGAVDLVVGLPDDAPDLTVRPTTPGGAVCLAP